MKTILFILCLFSSTCYGQGNFFFAHSVLAKAPKVTTTTASSVLEVEAVSGGDVTYSGTSTVTERGVCYGTSSNPSVSGNKIVSGSGTGIFYVYITSLIEGTLYHTRAYAINSTDTVYGTDKTFTTGISTPGNGKLYNWYAAAGTGDTAICTTGWHLPTLAEMNTLRAYLDPTSTQYSSNVAGNHMKETGTTHWQSESVGVDNSSGLTMYGSGRRDYSSGIFEGIKLSGYLWTSEYNYGYPIASLCAYNIKDFYPQGTTINVLEGYAVRLIKDNSTDTGTYTGNDGTTYNTVKIGNQVWIASNLKETKYRNGTDIPELVGVSQWANATSGAFCYYNNNSNYQ